MYTRVWTTTLALLVTGTLATVANAQEHSEIVIPTKHNKALTLGALAEIQPGLGTVMLEYGHRFYVAYYAAKAGNWELAVYELEEMREVQEVGETTRPGHAPALKHFEEDALKPLITAAKDKEWNRFTVDYAKATRACNACHDATGYSFIQYRLPEHAPDPIPSVVW